MVNGVELDKIILVKIHQEPLRRHRVLLELDDVAKKFTNYFILINFDFQFDLIFNRYFLIIDKIDDLC